MLISAALCYGFGIAVLPTIGGFVGNPSINQGDIVVHYPAIGKEAIGLDLTQHDETINDTT